MDNPCFKLTNIECLDNVKAMHHPIVRCPRCTNAITQNGAAFACVGCGAVYPFGDPIINFVQTLPLSEQKLVVQRHYDDLAEDYDSIIVSLIEGMECPWSTYTEIVEEFMAKLEGKIILDAGCGTSFPVGCFLAENSYYIGLDFSTRMLEYSNNLMKTGAHVSLLAIDIDHIPLPDASVDVCLALMAFNVFHDPRKAANEMDRVLVRGGDIFATVPLSSTRTMNVGVTRAMNETEVQGVISAFTERGRNIVAQRIGDILFVESK